MTEKESALYSNYIIDGIKLDATPADLLEECTTMPQTPPEDSFDDIIDEATDPPVTSFTYDSSLNSEYTEICLKAASEGRSFRMLYPDSYTRQRIASAVIDRLWNEGHYKLGNLRLWAKWSWNTRPLGNMAAFYASAESAGSYIYDLGVKLNDYIFEESDEESRVQFYSWLPDREETVEDEELAFKSSPFESRHPWISEERRCSETLVQDPDSTVIYIPFDTCKFRIGGSLLAQTNGHNGGTGPHIQDPDYFIDCYEVIRELVEDGIIMAGATVGDGGLATTLAGMCGGSGVDVDINGLMASYSEEDSTKMLFSEVPGVILQISDNDFDYLDSQLLLQDVAYYPIGKLSTEHEGIRFRSDRKTGVAEILASLLGQASEGED